MECRQFHRLLLQVDIIHSKAANERKHKSRTRNLSLGGICITTQEGQLETGNNYLLEFTLPGQKKPVQVTGRVVWARQYMHDDIELFDNGIEFIDMKPVYRKMIEEYSIGSITVK